MSRRSTPSLVRVGIAGAGGMANWHAENYKKIPGCVLAAVCDVDKARAEEFARRHGIPAAFSSIEEMLRTGSVDAVSVVTSDAGHAPVSLACLRAGKHVLCEKPLAVSATEARKMAAAAAKSGLVNMVNFSYRDWPCIQGARKAVAKGEIGEVVHVEASYLQAWLASKVWGDWRTNPTWLWRLSSQHGSRGALGDVGVHILDYASLPVGPIREVFCRLKTFPKAPGNRLGEYVLDANDSAVLTVEFGNGAAGVIHTTRWAAGYKNRLALLLCGTRGAIRMDSDHGSDSYEICAGRHLDRAQWKRVTCKPVPTTYQIFIRAIRTGAPYEPDFARGLEIQEVLESCFISHARNRPASPHPRKPPQA